VVEIVRTAEEFIGDEKEGACGITSELQSNGDV
jgi:hypothetical protein